MVTSTQVIRVILGTGGVKESFLEEKHLATKDETEQNKKQTRQLEYVEVNVVQPSPKELYSFLANLVFNPHDV